jgi:acyl-coenzyme A thioesterase PaaI-like protein
MTGAPHERDVGFTSELGLNIEVAGDTLIGRAEVVPELCVRDAAVLRPSVLLSWADSLVGSLATERTLPRVCMTVDLNVRVVTPIPAGASVLGTGRILKTGRVLTFTEATFTVDGSDEPAAFVVGTFVASPRPEDVADSFVTRVTRGSAERRRNQAPLVPITEILGARVVTPGVVEADRHARIMNWVETVQGGAVALLAEEAALSLPDAPVPSELEMRYLRTVRFGPMRATARSVGEFTRVDVVDVGNDNRPAAIGVVRG